MKFISRISARSHFSVLPFIALLLYGCSGSSIPSEADARKVFESKLKSHIDKGTIKIVSFKKNNGQAGMFLGKEIYKVEFEAVVEYPKGLNSHCKKDKFTTWDCFNVDIRQVGEKERINQKISFEKTEKGWRGPDKNIY